MNILAGSFFPLCLLLAVLVGCAPDGAALFQKEGCVNCHRLKGVGGSIGPDLTDVSSRRSDQFIRQQLRDSSVNNPNSAMPSFKHLSEKEIQALIDYLKS
ncbi:MAG: c-type cytochrome [Thermodesulfovibrionales bacterium]